MIDGGKNWFYTVKENNLLLENEKRMTALFFKFYRRGISLKVFRVDRILEGAVGIQEYKNSVNTGPHI